MGSLCRPGKGLQSYLGKGKEETRQVELGLNRTPRGPASLDSCQNSETRLAVPRNGDASHSISTNQELEQSWLSRQRNLLYLALNLLKMYFINSISKISMYFLCVQKSWVFLFNVNNINTMKTTGLRWSPLQKSPLQKPIQFSRRKSLLC